MDNNGIRLPKVETKLTLIPEPVYNRVVLYAVTGTIPTVAKRHILPSNLILIQCTPNSN